MGNFKKELFLYLNNPDWDISEYSSEKYQLTLQNQQSFIDFILTTSTDICLKGKVVQKILEDTPIIDFKFDDESQWIKNCNLENYKIIELLEHLFLFMESK